MEIILEVFDLEVDVENSDGLARVERFHAPENTCVGGGVKDLRDFDETHASSDVYDPRLLAPEEHNLMRLPDLAATAGYDRVVAASFQSLHVGSREIAR